MKNLYLKASAWASVTAMTLLPFSALAQLSDAETELEKVGAPLISTGTASDLPKLIGNLINVFLSVLGIIFVVLVVYAGYLWMTDAGEGSKAKKAKGILGTAVMGIVLTIAAYAISAFVIEQIVGAASA